MGSLGFLLHLCMEKKSWVVPHHTIGGLSGMRSPSIFSKRESCADGGRRREEDSTSNRRQCANVVCCLFRQRRCFPSAVRPESHPSPQPSSSVAGSSAWMREPFNHPRSRILLLFLSAMRHPMGSCRRWSARPWRSLCSRTQHLHEQWYLGNAKLDVPGVCYPTGVALAYHPSSPSTLRDMVVAP
jgi:hypothetical protein